MLPSVSGDNKPSEGVKMPRQIVDMSQVTDPKERKIPVWISVGAAVLLVSAVIYGATHQPAVTAAVATSPASLEASPTPDCSPSPCIRNGDGMIVHVQAVDRNWPATGFNLDAGSHVLRITTSFEWQGTAGDTGTPNPLDFRVIDSTGIKTGELVTLGRDMPGCESWSGPEFGAPGAKFGPQHICFEIAGDPAAQVTLVYQTSIFADKHTLTL